MEARGEERIKQRDGWMDGGLEQERCLGLVRWGDGGVYSRECVCIRADVGVELPLAMHDAAVR